MEPSTNPQPRDSRLEKFSATASHIISTERGLTSTALSKIRYLATEQHLSENQVIECLDRIGDGSPTLGRVGRYEQMFLDRLSADLSRVRGTVLSPTTAQEAIRLAADEYQISASRAQQLLDHVAKERGLHQISAADAQNRIRMLIAQKVESSNRQRGDFEDELVGHAADFGISADEVSKLFDTEIETRNQRRTRNKSRLIAVAASVLFAILATAAGCWLWLNTQTADVVNQTTAQPIIDSNPIEIKDAEAIDGSPNRVDEPTTELPLGASEASKFEIGDLISLPNTAPVLRFEKWQERVVELVGQDFEQSLAETATSSVADRQKKKNAFDALQSEQSGERILTRALDDLSALASRIEDITPEEAKSIAAFCFQKHNASIEVSIVRTVKQFGRWPSFLLAVSDAFTVDDQQNSADDWKQRVAFAITDGKLKNNDDFSASFFAMARLRVREILNERERTQAVRKTDIEGDFVKHLRQFISDNMNAQHHQAYFNRLIDARSLQRPSMQRQIELQQILVEALLFAKSDDESLAIGETLFDRLNSAATMGDQLALSREAVSKLVALHLEWLKRSGSVAGASSHRESRWLEAPATDEARRLRDEAETMAMSGNDAQIANAVAKYRSAIACGDRAIIRSCLRALIAIANSRTDRNGYQRQLDFVNGGQQGPYLSFAGDAGDGSSTPADWQAIKSRCRQLRRSSISQENSTAPATGKAAEIWAALNGLANRQSPLSIFELDLLLRIESEAAGGMESGEVSLWSIQLPHSIQAALPPKEITLLVPLRR